MSRMNPWRIARMISSVLMLWAMLVLTAHAMPGCTKDTPLSGPQSPLHQPQARHHGGIAPGDQTDANLATSPSPQGVAGHDLASSGGHQSGGAPCLMHGCCVPMPQIILSLAQATPHRENYTPIVLGDLPPGLIQSLYRPPRI